jgi:RNA polymerase sigma-70 factor (ECF subfamily)
MTFEEIYQRQYPHIKYYALQRTGNHEDAEDIAQTAFLHLYKAFDRFEVRNDCRGLLITMMKWLVIERYRKRKKMPTDEIDENLPVDHTFPDHLPDNLLNAVWKLPRLQRRAVVMYFWADMTYEEIAHAMGTGVSTAHYRKDAGVKSLRASLL